MNAVLRVAVPSKGRLRDQTIQLLRQAGYRVSSGLNASNLTEGIEFIEMRPGDAAAWLRAGRLDAAFISTDTALENAIEAWPTVPLGFARSDLVVACREDESWTSASDLAGKTVATHLPAWTERFFAARAIDATVVSMGGALEGVCAVGLADAIVDLRETGGSLIRNRLRVLEEVHACEATFVTAPEANADAIDLMRLRVSAALAARRTHYVMLHIDADRVDDLTKVFHGLDSPTVLPLAGRSDRVAAHMVVEKNDLWRRLQELRDLGATDIVALPTDAIL
ncbi:MAG: ATP phosphoribosyltransferase [Acidimicrobiales bacterium]|nr:ATP phosphoribosyltransferase [Acidimicrobiales bacterium]